LETSLNEGFFGAAGFTGADALGFQKRMRLFFLTTVLGGGTLGSSDGVSGKSDLDRKMRPRRVNGRCATGLIGTGVSSGVGGRFLVGKAAVTLETPGVTSLESLDV
jgi:hypothetical protein